MVVVLTFEAGVSHHTPHVGGGGNGQPPARSILRDVPTRIHFLFFTLVLRFSSSREHFPSCFQLQSRDVPLAYMQVQLGGPLSAN